MTEAGGGATTSSPISPKVAIAVVVAIVIVTAAIFVATAVAPSANRPSDQGDLGYCAQTPSLSASSSPAIHKLGGEKPVGEVPPLEAPPAYFALTNSSNWAVPGLSCYGFTVSYAAPNLTVGDSEFEVKTVDCGNVSQSWIVQYVDDQGHTFASQYGSGGGWGPSMNASVVTGDRVVVSAAGPLNGDELDSKISYHGGSGETAQLLGNYTGAWDGCTF